MFGYAILVLLVVCLITVRNCVIVKKSVLPFHKEVTRLINKHREYLDGIEKGVVHLHFDPNQKPKEAVTEQ